MTIRRLFFTALSLTALSFAPLRAETPTRYDLNVGEFDRLEVDAAINVNYVSNPDSAGHAVFYATPRTASTLIFQPGKGKLSVQLSDDADGLTGLPTVTLYSSFLSKATNSGDSTLRIISLAPLPKISLKLIGNGRLIARDLTATAVDASLQTGNGTIVLSGRCDEASFKFTGTGQIQADDLKAQEVTVKSWGTGSIGVWAVRKLGVYGMGSSKIYFKGQPEIKKSSVGLKVISIATAEEQ